MKKIFFTFSFIIVSFFFSFSDASALTLKDGTLLTHENFNQYVEELGYDYWRENIGSDYFAIIPSKTAPEFFRFHIIKASELTHQQYYSDPIGIACVDFSCYHKTVNVWQNPDSFDFNFTSTYFAGFGTQTYDYSNAFSTFYFKSYDGNSYLLQPNFDNSFESDIEYTIIFNIPSGASLVVKDIDGNIIEPNSTNTYSLKVGEYIYSVSKEGYYSKDNVLFKVLENSTIDISLESKLNNTTIHSVFNQYYTYISNLVSDIFSIENPIFLYLVSFIIGFSIITFIKNILGGH